MPKKLSSGSIRIYLFDQPDRFFQYSVLTKKKRSPLTNSKMESNTILQHLDAFTIKGNHQVMDQITKTGRTLLAHNLITIFVKFQTFLITLADAKTDNQKLVP